MPIMRCWMSHLSRIQGEGEMPEYTNHYLTSHHKVPFIWLPRLPEEITPSVDLRKQTGHTTNWDSALTNNAYNDGNTCVTQYISETKISYSSYWGWRFGSPVNILAYRSVGLWVEVQRMLCIKQQPVLCPSCPWPCCSGNICSDHGVRTGLAQREVTSWKCQEHSLSKSVHFSSLQPQCLCSVSWITISCCLYEATKPTGRHFTCWYLGFLSSVDGWIYSAFRKYSYPLTYSTFCCYNRNSK